jgi:hypothetical protein
VMQKRLLVPSRVRRIPQQFSWVDQRLVREHHIERCKVEALALYLFLITVADAQGLSYYGDRSISRRLSLPSERLIRAREALIDAGLIAYEAPLYQVLSLDTPPATMPLSISPSTHVCSPDATRGFRSLREVLRQTLGDPS